MNYNQCNFENYLDGSPHTTKMCEDDYQLYTTSVKIHSKCLLTLNPPNLPLPTQGYLGNIKHCIVSNEYFVANDSKGRVKGIYSDHFSNLKCFFFPEI